MAHIRTQSNIRKRILATIVDYGVYMGFWFFFVYRFGIPNDDGGYTVNGWPGFILFLTWFVYFPLIESYKGQTFGHMLTGLRVISLNGKAITFGQSLKRRVLDAFELFGTFGIIAFIAAKNTERNQRVGDLWAKTVVIKN